MRARMMAAAGALLGMLSVGTGAFGAHGLAERVPAADLAVWETAARYQMYHALGLLALAALVSGLPMRARLASAAAWCFLIGVLIFSGSLYLLVLTDARWLGAVTPIGGVLLMAGWLLMAAGAWRESA